jgi:hypothetical protein
MNANEFKAAFAIASSDKDLSDVSFDHLFGFGLKDFQPVSTTLDAIAKVIRWQTLFMNGTWDQEELDTIRSIGRKQFIVIDACFVLAGDYTANQQNIIKSAARMIKATSKGENQ